MGRRKIDIKKIKDERNRSVTFLKRKGGLFKKAYELSVLCDVDVAVVIFGNNKKLHQFSSRDMREMLHRWTLHGEPNEYRTPADFNANAADDDDDEDDENATPPRAEGMDPHMLPPQFQAQPQFPVMRHHTPSGSPPIQNGVFGPRGHTPQPQMTSRPASRNDIHRMGPAMVPQPVGPPGPPQAPVNGYGYMPQQPVFGPQNPHSMPPNMPHVMAPVHPSYPYAQQQPQPQPQPQPHQMQAYVDDQRRASGPTSFPMQHPPQAPPPPPPPARHSVSPPQPPAPQLPAQLPQQPYPQMSPPQPQPHQPHNIPMQSPPQPQQHLPPPPPPPQPQEVPQVAFTAPTPQEQPQPAPAPAPVESRPKPELPERTRQLPALDTNIKKLPPRKGGSIFTPIDENRSVLSQHLAAFNPPEPKPKPEESQPARSQSSDVSTASRPNVTSPPTLPRINTQVASVTRRNGSLGNIPETTFTPPSRSNSIHTASTISRPRLKVQIPDESDGGSATNDSSPRGTTTAAADNTSQPARRPESHVSGVVLPPPSPSHSSTLLSAGATGPPNPFARPPPQSSSMNIDTPVSALPSRFLGDGLLPSPSSFYADWGLKGNEHNTLSPLTWQTPVVGTGPSFLRDDLPPLKRKSPDLGNSSNNGGNGGDQQQGEGSSEQTGNDAKRVKVE
ncbi:hypothetical protein VTJ04DRAFT_1417 [Mycothermus thermophilus]|uniref:uncharacterized protein n=1 Tax=Humicola insolens TaxID=85995 RepID=UPI0037434714